MKPKPARDISRHIFAALSPCWVLRLKQLRCSGSSGHRLQRLVNTNTTHSHPNTTHEDDWRCVKKGPQSALVAIKAVWDSLLFIHCWGHVWWGSHACCSLNPIGPSHLCWWCKSASDSFRCHNTNRLVSYIQWLLRLQYWAVSIGTQLAPSKSCF